MHASPKLGPASPCRLANDAHLALPLAAGEHSRAGRALIEAAPAVQGAGGPDSGGGAAPGPGQPRLVSAPSSAGAAPLVLLPFPKGPKGCWHQPGGSLWQQPCGVAARAA